MKLFLPGILFIMISCADEPVFIYGKWYNETNTGLTIYEITEDTLSVTTNNRLLYKGAVKLLDCTGDYAVVNVETEIDENIAVYHCKFSSIDNDRCLLINYKSHIHPGRIDEVSILTRNPRVEDQLSAPSHQEIRLPDDHSGRFYIVYSEDTIDRSSKINIKNDGIGYSAGFPDLLQLFHANRTFKFQNSGKELRLVNPYDYGLKGYKDIDFHDEEILIIQNGFNQFGRISWNKLHGLNIQTNIEFFEITIGRELRERLNNLK